MQGIMRYLDWSEAVPERNLAVDEALLEACEASGEAGVLRCYESLVPFVVVGFGNQTAVEADTEACAQAGIPVLRRVSGGGTVVLGPGCLAYALVVPIDSSPDLATVTGTNRFVMERHRQAIEGLLGRAVRVQGHTDLTVDGRKFSGNAQRRRRRTALFHGTLLLDFDLSLVGRFLRMPSQQPDYREGRDHGHFLTNLHVTSARVKAALRGAWGAQEPWGDPLQNAVDRLMTERYGRPEWHRRR